MKWSIVGLVVMGVVAALCATVLMVILSAPRRAPAETDPEVSILVAAHDLPEMSQVDKSSLETQKVAKSHMPAGALTSPVEAIGRFLADRVVSGTPLRSEMFVADGTGAQLAAKLEPGKRAVAISLSDFGGLEGALYLGSVVDVLLTVPGGPNGRSSTGTVLEGVKVLGIDRQMITAKDPEKADDAARHISSTSRRVTLQVTSHEAAKLQQAASMGTLSLALRNPLDKDLTDTAMSFVQDTGAAPVAPVVQVGTVGSVDPPATAPTPPVEVVSSKTPTQANDVMAQKPTWRVEEIRGTNVTHVEFPIEGSGNAEPHK